MFHYIYWLKNQKYTLPFDFKYNFHSALKRNKKKVKRQKLLYTGLTGMHQGFGIYFFKTLGTRV